MITQPLTITEEEALRQVKKDIKSIDIYTSFGDEKVLIEIDKENKEAWLNILSLAERANEIVTEQWRSSAKSMVNF